MLAACYLRVSTDEQARDGVSLAVQEQRCTEAARAAGATDVVVYRDDGWSGTTAERPELMRLLADLHGIDTVFVWKLDRLSRSVRDWANLMDVFAKHDTGFVSVTEAFDFSSPMGRAMMAMLAVFAELFVDILRENVRAALQHRAEQGHQHGRAPLGYDWPRGDDGKPLRGSVMQPVVDEVAVVRDLFSLAASGMSLRQVAIAAQDLYKPPNGATRWHISTVGGLLRNAAYIGMVRLGDDLYEGLHEPIVDSATFERVRQNLANNAALPRRCGSLSPLLSCGICGGAVNCGGAGTERMYRCSVREGLPVDDRHEPVGITGQKAEAMVWAWTRHLFSADVIARAARKIAKKRATTDAGKTEQLERDRAVLTERIRRNAERASAGLIPDDVLADVQGPLIAERERIDRELARHRDVTDVDFAGLSGLADEAQATLDAIEQSDARVQVQFLQRIYERIDLHSDHLLFHHRLPIPDKRVDAPAYYSRVRGVTDIPF